MPAYRLVVEKGPSKGQAIRVKKNASVVVGREASNGLRLADPQASRKHFRVEAKLDEYVLQDLGSSNGTFVNGARVTSCKLAPGDKIAVGESLVYFLEERPEEAGARQGDLTGREVAGYRVGRLLGRGGMGTVYEAVQLSLERTVAFKTLSPELARDAAFVERFISEARAAGRLNHANIVSVFDVGQEGELYFYSMEHMPGGSLDDLLRRDGPLPVERTLPMIFDAARGLEYAEKHGLIHRDIKPDNLMLGPEEVVKICDLGLAIFSSQQGDVSGSPHYIAPEQALGKDLDARADLYALGVTWYHLLCGKTPFSGRTPQEIARKHVEEEPPSLRELAPTVPEDVAALVARLMAKDREARVPSARQLQADLAELARRHPVRETVMLRIAAAAPDVPPSDAVALPEGEAQGASRLPLALGALAGVLLVVAFLVTNGVLSARAERLAKAKADVAAARGLLEAGELERAVARAGELAAELEAAGLAEQAASALAVAEQARARREEAAREQREASARERLETARALSVEELEGPIEPDPALKPRLEELERMLGTVIEDYADTDAAVEAQALRKRVSARLRELREALEARDRRAAEARRAVDRAKQRIVALLDTNVPSRFVQAIAAIEEYTAEFGDIERRGGEALLELVRGRAEREVRARTSSALLLIAQRRWGEARVELDAVAPPLGFADLEAQVAEAQTALEEGQRQAVAEEQAERERADRRRLDESLEALRTELAARRYADAASSLRSELVLLQTDAARRLAALRITRLERAERAFEPLVAHVEAGKPGVELELEATGVSARRARAVRYDRFSRRLTFQLTERVMRDVAIADLEPVRLLSLFASLGLDPAQRLDLACLAAELGEYVRAAQLLNEVAALEPALRREVEDMQVLAATGQ